MVEVGKLKLLDALETFLADVVAHVVRQTAGRGNEDPHADGQRNGEDSINDDRWPQVQRISHFHDIVHCPASDECEAGLYQRDDHCGNRQRHQQTLVGQRMAEYSIPQTEVELVAEDIFLGLIFHRAVSANISFSSAF